jgi:hypothetical protein
MICIIVVKLVVDIPVSISIELPALCAVLYLTFGAVSTLFIPAVMLIIYCGP